MFRLILTLVSFVLAVSALADDAGMNLRIRKYALDSGAPPSQIGRFACLDGVIVEWRVPGVPVPTMQQLMDVTNPELGGYDVADLVKDAGGKYRAKTQAEKTAEQDVAQAAAQAAKVAAAAAAQAAKPLSQKKLENRYIRICNDVMVVAGDPRAGTGALISIEELYNITETADTKKADKELAKATRQLVMTINLLDRADPAWFSTLKYDPAAGE